MLISPFQIFKLTILMHFNNGFLFFTFLNIRNLQKCDCEFMKYIQVVKTLHAILIWLVFECEAFYLVTGE